MNNPFENKAIKFATEQELNHLAELARGYGLGVERLSCTVSQSRYFRKAERFTFYSDFYNPRHLPEITYSDFIASLEPTEIDYKKAVLSRFHRAVCNIDTNGMYSVTYGGNVTEKVHDKISAWKFAYYTILNSDSEQINTEQPDMVNHPKHYNVDGYEVIDIIDAFKLNFNMGNALKYLLRADRKGNKLQDINKAIWYLQREIEQSEKQN
jgi:hypothetical protein